MERSLTPYLETDLEKKMIFIAGPRQCGKTTIARILLDRAGSSTGYFNWDYDEDRRAILSKRFPLADNTVVFDELHKFPRWKNFLKGIYDVHGGSVKIIVTGSARLDYYRHGGDSLLGRYHLWRLHPLGLDEYPPGMTRDEAFKRLMTIGGFPEPFLAGDEREARRWRRDRLQRIIRDDIRDLEQVREIGMLELFLDMLRSRVGGMVTISNIATDLEAAPKTVSHWLEIFERMYLVFTVRPYTKNLPRAVRKPPKVYFYDNADVTGDEGARFENLVATHLLKRIQFLEDYTGHEYTLSYLRDKEGREVDFVVLKNGIVDVLVEAKYSDDSVSSSLVYYAERLKPRRAIQLCASVKRPYHSKGIDVMDVSVDFWNYIE